MLGARFSRKAGSAARAVVLPSAEQLFADELAGFHAGRAGEDGAADVGEVLAQRVGPGEAPLDRDELLPRVLLVAQEQ